MFNQKLKIKYIKNYFLFFIFILLPNFTLDIYFLLLPNIALDLNFSHNHSASILRFFSSYITIYFYVGFILSLNFLAYALFKLERLYAKLNIVIKMRIESYRNILIYIIYSIIIFGFSIVLNIRIYDGISFTWTLALLFSLFISVFTTLYGEYFILNRHYKDDSKISKKDADIIFAKSIFVTSLVIVIYFFISALIFGIVHLVF